MTDLKPPSGVDRIDLTRSEDPRDVVHGVVIALSQGERILIATEQVFGVMSSVLFAEEASTSSTSNSVLADDPWALPTLLVRGAEELADWVGPLSPATLKLARRGWPGAVGLLFRDPGASSLFQRLPLAARRTLGHERGVLYQSPDSSFILDVLKLLAAPALLQPLPATDDLESLAARVGCRRIVESPRSGSHPPVSIIEVDSAGARVVRAGAIDEAELSRLTATLIVFICTGNTCRSPMAEALCKVLIAERLGCDPRDLPARGYVVASAGVSAMNGMPAAAHAIDVVRARGGSLEGHRSSRVSHALVSAADHLLAMTADHLDALLHHAPDAAARARLLHPDGHDVADPVGSDLAIYRRTADEIEAYLREFINTLVV